MTMKIRLEISSPTHSRGKGTVRQLCENVLKDAGWKITNRHYSFHFEILHLEKPYEITPGGKE